MSSLYIKPSEAPVAGLNNPDAILQGWEGLMNEHHHLHPPEAARRLGVPEAALVAARIGQGAKRLFPDAARLLAPIEGWGRVLCAFSNKGGVHMPLGAVSAQSSGDRVHLRSDALEAQIDGSVVAHAFLFQDQDDAHGRTRSLQLYNAEGMSIVKVFIFHKTRFGVANEHFETLAHPDQSRTFQLEPVKPSDFDAQAISKAIDADLEEQTQTLPELIGALFDAPGHYEVEMVAPHSWVQWNGSVEGVRIDDVMFHLHEGEVRSHLRFAPVQSVSKTTSGGFALNGEGGRLIRIKKRAAS